MIVLNDASDTTFRSLWNLDLPVRVIANAEISNFPGLGSAGDEVNLFNNSGGLVDRFTFGAAVDPVLVISNQSPLAAVSE